MKQYLVFDIGGTNLKYALINENGEIKYKGHQCTVSTDLKSFLNEIYEVCDQYKGKFDGIALSCPGKVDVKNKIVYHGGSLPFLDGLNIQKTLGERYDVAVSVENDGKCAALAEQWQGTLRGIENGAVLVLGTGVGGGIIIDHRLLHGVHFQAGEVSFMRMGMDPQKGMEQCFGFIGSATEMVKRVNQACNHGDLTDGLAAFDSINSGDSKANMIFEDYCEKIAYLIMNIQAVVDLEKIAIGGGISAQPILVETIAQKYQTLHDAEPILKATITPPEIVNAQFGNEANLYGAMYAMMCND